MESNDSFFEKLKHSLGFGTKYVHPSVLAAQKPSVYNKLIYTSDGTNQKGPFTFDQLCGLWKNGQVTANSFYAIQGESKWNPIMEISNLLSQDSSSASLIEEQKNTNSLISKIFLLLFILFVVLPLIGWLVLFLTH